MTIRDFIHDKWEKKTKLTAYGYRCIEKEMSSEDDFTKNITNYALDLLYDVPMHYRFVVKSTAMCAEGDEYDPKKGEEICNVKADLKYHQKMYDRYLKVAWLLRKVSNRLMEYVDLHQKKIERLEKDLEQYM